MVSPGSYLSGGLVVKLSDQPKEVDNDTIDARPISILGKGTRFGARASWGAYSNQEDACTSGLACLAAR